MHRLAYLVFVLAGCPAPGRYVVADVTAHRVPVQGALVATNCGTPHGDVAQRTDEEGRARMRVKAENVNRCSLLVAKPGLPTVETGPVNVCPTATACEPTRIEMTYAPRPAARVIEEAPTRVDRRPLEVAQ